MNDITKTVFLSAGLWFVLSNVATADCSLPNPATYQISLLKGGHSVNLESLSMANYSQTCGGAELSNHSVIHFASNQATLNQQIREKLSLFLKTVKAQSVVLKIIGFTDSIGSKSYNQQLGLDRAKAVASFLEDHGVLPQNISVKSQGESQPIADNTTAHGQALNRRVVIRVI